MSLVPGVRPSSRTSPTTWRKIKYSSRSDTPGSCLTSDYRWSATQDRLLAPHRIAWAALPHDFPPYKTVYGLFTRWAATGSWQHLHDALRDQVRVYEGRDPTPTAAIIDSQSVRGADTVPTRSRGYDAGKRVNGRKRHIATDTGGLLMAVVVTVAGVQDRDAAHRLLTALRAQFCTVSHVWADGGYAGRVVVWAHRVLALTVQIVKRTDDLAGFRVLPRRWVVEGTFGWIRAALGDGPDYDRAADDGRRRCRGDPVTNVADVRSSAPNRRGSLEQTLTTFRVAGRGAPVSLQLGVHSGTGAILR
jgi:transposase